MALPLPGLFFLEKLKKPLYLCIYHAAQQPLIQHQTIIAASGEICQATRAAAALRVKSLNMSFY
jgi:hypothetical protein